MKYEIITAEQKMSFGIESFEIKYKYEIMTNYIHITTLTHYANLPQDVQRQQGTYTHHLI